MSSRSKRLVEAALKGINTNSIEESTHISPKFSPTKVVEHDDENQHDRNLAEVDQISLGVDLSCSFSGIVPFESSALPDNISVCEVDCILNQPTNEWREYYIANTDDTLLPVFAEDEVEVMEIVEVEGTHFQETNSIKIGGKVEKEVMEKMRTEKNIEPVQELNLMENEPLAAEDNASHEKNVKAKSSDFKTIIVNDNNRNSSDDHSSTSLDNQVSRISKKRLKAQKKRVSGLSYMGYKKLENGKVIQNCKRTLRSVKQRCGHTKTSKRTSRTFLCNLISDTDRQLLFKKFWNFASWYEKKAFVNGLVSTRNVRKRRNKAEENNEITFKKKIGHDIFLPSSTGDRVKVCRLFFINTLNLGEDTFRRWVMRNEDDEISDSEETSVTSNNNEEQPKAKKCKVVGIKKKTHEEMKENVVKWLKLLPIVPSHYCRSNSTCTYVESTFRSLSHMHNVFEEWCKQNTLKCVSITFFLQVLKDQNIKIHHPRKDQCDIFCGYGVKMVTQEVYQKHIEMKNEARDAKNEVKGEANENHLVMTMDLQSVLLCPKTEASAMYYKQKLQLHNFTIFVLNNKDVTLYVWHESNGGVTSNEFTSCVIDFISSQADNIKMFTIISDGCNYQNRNKTLASALRSLASEKTLLIRQLFLEKGHTMMECDSVHAALEKYFIPPLNSPSDYIAQMRSARPKHTYNIKVLDYSFFYNFENLSTNIQSLRPGKKTGDPHVVDIRALEYRSNGKIYFKLRHPEAYKVLPQRKIKAIEVPRPTRLYTRLIPINESKWKCLQDLKKVIEKDHHSFYDNIPFQPDKKFQSKNK